MAIPNQILDGTPAYGTTSITIGANTYVLNKESMTLSWTSAENFTAAGLPNQKRWTKGRWQFSAELQLGSGATTYPVSGTTFTRTPPNETSAVTFVVLEMPYESDNQPGSIRVANMTAEQVIGSITTA